LPDGILVVGTGNGTVSQGLEDAIRAAQKQGVTIGLASRCAQGGVVRDAENDWMSVPGLNWPQMRWALLLSIMAGQHQV
jgi:L-asparaginase